MEMTCLDRGASLPPPMLLSTSWSFADGLISGNGQFFASVGDTRRDALLGEMRLGHPAVPNSKAPGCGWRHEGTLLVFGTFWRCMRFLPWFIASSQMGREISLADHGSRKQVGRDKFGADPRCLHAFQPCWRAKDERCWGGRGEPHGQGQRAALVKTPCVVHQHRISFPNEILDGTA